jgi:hypothetical protein
MHLFTPEKNPTQNESWISPAFTILERNYGNISLRLWLVASPLSITGFDFFGESTCC